MNSLLHIIVHYYIKILFLAGCLLNFHEGVRTQAASWIPFAWMPAYDDKLAPSRDKSGFESNAARRVRLEHKALLHVFKDWDGAASTFNGRPNGRITGMDMRHLLLLLPFLPFDLLHDEVHDHNSPHGTSYESPAADLIAWVLVLLEWYRLYRCRSWQ